MIRSSLRRTVLFCAVISFLSLHAAAQSNGDAAWASAFGSFHGTIATMAQLKTHSQIPAAPPARSPASPADKELLHSRTQSAFGAAISMFTVFSLIETAYPIACDRPESHTALRMIDMMISRLLDNPEFIANCLLEASAVASSDVIANSTARALVVGFGTMSTRVAGIMVRAKRCEDFMTAKDEAAKNASGGSDMTWNAARSQASINVARLSQFDVSAGLKAAQALVVKTQ